MLWNQMILRVFMNIRGVGVCFGPLPPHLTNIIYLYTNTYIIYKDGMLDLIRPAICIKWCNRSIAALRLKFGNLLIIFNHFWCLRN
jgi:hypothetical protein